MHRFFVSPSILAAEPIVLPRELSQQVVRVLRLRPGAQVALFCGDGDELLAELAEVTSKAVTARAIARRTPNVELGCRLHAAVAVLKGEKPEWVVQKLAELGAARITLLVTERTVVSAGEERWPRRLERYARVAQEAAEQCGRVRLPAIDGPVPLAELLAGPEDGARYLLHPSGERSLAATLIPCPPAVTLLIGPEGGFAPSEVEQARQAGVEVARLGPRVLRAETAAIAAAALAAAASDQ